MANYMYSKHRLPLNPGRGLYTLHLDGVSGKLFQNLNTATRKSNVSSWLLQTIAPDFHDIEAVIIGNVQQSVIFMHHIKVKWTDVLVLIDNIANDSFELASPLLCVGLFLLFLLTCPFIRSSGKGIALPIATNWH